MCGYTVRGVGEEASVWRSTLREGVRALPRPIADEIGRLAGEIFDPDRSRINVWSFAELVRTVAGVDAPLPVAFLQLWARDLASLVDANASTIPAGVQAVCWLRVAQVRLRAAQQAPEVLGEARAAIERAVRPELREISHSLWLEALLVDVRLLVEDDPRAGLERARHVLADMTPEAEPDAWLAGHILVGMAVRRLGASRPPEDLVDLSVRALAVEWERANPVRLVEAWHDLGGALIDRSGGARGEELDLAIEVLGWSATFAEDVGGPERIRYLSMTLARALVARRGDEDLARAVGLFDAVAATPPAVEPDDLALAARLNAASARLGMRADRVAHREHAIASFVETLSSSTGRLDPSERAMVLGALAQAYLERTAGDRADNLQRAIAACDEALTLISREGHPPSWASIKHDLARAYLRRVGGDEVENNNIALANMRDTLTARDRERDPEAWASSQRNLAAILLDRCDLTGEDLADDAIDACLNALQVQPRESMPAEWGASHVNLGCAYQRRRRGGREDNLAKAMEAFENAATVAERMPPEMWARAQLNMAETLVDLAVRERDAAVRAAVRERAIRLAEEARPALAAADVPEAAIMAVVALADALTLRGAWPEGTVRACAVLREARAACPPERHPRLAQIVCLQLARLLHSSGSLEEAYAATMEALRAWGYRYLQAATEPAQRRAIAEADGIHQLAIELSRTLGHPASETLAHAENARARVMRESVGPLWRTAPASVPDGLVGRQDDLRDRWRDLRASLERGLGRRDSTALRLALAEERQLRKELEGVWEAMARDGAGAAFVAAQRGEAARWEAVRRWIDDQPTGFALVVYHVLQDRTLAFVGRQGWVEPAVVEIPLGLRVLVDRVVSFYHEMDAWAVTRRKQTWQSLGGPLLREVLPLLDGASLACVVPHLVLHHLPLHALEWEGRALIERFPVVYAPSVTLAVQLGSTPAPVRSRSPDSAMVVGDPTGDLPGARAEAIMVARRLGTEALLGEAASKERVEAVMRGRTIAHFATHASLRIDRPWLSGLRLAGGQTLTAADVRRLGSVANLVVLTGCNTGFRALAAGDDTMGLAVAMLFAGAATTVAGLWPVDDRTTADLVGAFYDALDAGPSIDGAVAGALRQAMLAVRERHPEPYFWAPLVAVGDWR
jgi:CHAT domain-containing protein/tetratricopeptide (TPR) repeat protein